MLNVWVNNPKTDKLVVDVGMTFENYMAFELIDTDLGRRIVKETSRVVDVENYKFMKTDFDTYISPLELSDGAKVLLLMLCKEVQDLGLIFNYTYCGPNCDKFVEEIADMCDVNIYLGRYYIPFSSGKPKSGVKFMETGTVVYDKRGYIREHSTFGG